VLTNYGEKISEEEFGELLREAKIDSDGNVNYMDLVKTLLAK
jgi:calmodulin